jgi:Amt family ammonium transporter
MTKTNAELLEDLKTMEGDFGEALDTIWMLLAGLLVFFMHAGFSLLEAGCVRFKNTQNILAKNLLVVSLGFLCWYFTGWVFAYGVSTEVAKPNKFIGTKEIFMDGFWDDKTKFRNWFFQGAFCATAATIVSGAMAERTQLKGFAIYTVIMTAFIYPVVCYWGWSGNGLLNYTDDNDKSVSAFGPNYIDFAGSGIVHLVGGIGALLGSAIVGKRKGQFEPGCENTFIPHSIPFCVLGTFILWFGWYGFNPGSTLAMKTKDNAVQAGLVAVNTTRAPCMAGLIVFTLRAVVIPPQLLDVGAFCNGILAGLVSITAGCGFVKPWEAVVIGSVGGFVYQGASMLLKKAGIDDVVDAFPVHGACGIWGVLALGLFGDPDHGMGGNGLFYGGDQFRVQVMGCVVIIAWVAVLSLPLLLGLKFASALRLGDEYQDAGADVMKHSPPKAYTQPDKERAAEEPAKEPPAPAPPPEPLDEI